MKSKKSQNIFTNTLTAQIVFVLVVASGILFFEKFLGEKPSGFKNVSENKAVVFVDFDNMKKIFTGEVVEKMTVLDALNASVAAGKIKLIYYVDENNNTQVLEINNHKADKKTRFNFYVNSQELDQNEINKTYIQADDKIVIKLEQNDQIK